MNQNEYELFKEEVDKFIKNRLVYEYKKFFDKKYLTSS